VPPLISRIDIRSGLGQLADQFDLPRVGTDWFTAAVPNKPVEILVGYNGQSLHQLVGEADEFELAWTALSLVGGLRGRSLGGRLVDRHFKKTYFLTPPIPAPPITFAVGIFTARQIASEIASAVGLRLRWVCPDYTIQEKAFAVSGSAGESIRRLAQLIGQPEMFAVDVYTDGDEIVVKQREGTPPVADYRLTNAELMTASVTYRKRPGPIYGTLTIIGGTKGGPIIEQDDEDLPQLVTETEVNETKAEPPKRKSRETTTRQLLRAVANEVLLNETVVTEIEQDLAAQPAAPTLLLSGSSLSDSQYRVGQATFQFPSTALAQDDAYNGTTLRLTRPDGATSLDFRITDYTGATRTATLDRAITQALDSRATWRVDEKPLTDPAQALSFITVAKTVKTIRYDDERLLDTTGRIAIPVKEVEKSEFFSIMEDREALALSRRETVTYGYNHDLELILQDILIEALSEEVRLQDPAGFTRIVGGSLIPIERRLIRHERLDANQYQTTTKIFAVEAVKAASGTVVTEPAMTLVETDTKVTRGQLPGPQRIRRPQRKAIGSGGGSSNKVLKEITISTDPDAIDVQISNQNIDEALATLLVSQYSQASGLWRHEVTIRGLALPFLQKGRVLEWAEALPGLSAPLPRSLITGRSLHYDERGDSPSFTSTITLTWWGAAN
jgi:hypothetical protein